MVGGSQRPREAAYFEELQASAMSAGISDRVRFLGQRSDVPRLLAAADIFCQPNIEPEPFGIVFVEALYARLPVITMAMGGALEIVDDSCGVLVQRDDVGALADALGALIHDLPTRKMLGAAGPARACQLCDPMRQIGRLKEVLARVCST
jgi:glycosyltransferase involved in cell wall biosynthesis